MAAKKASRDIHEEKSTADTAIAQNAADGLGSTSDRAARNRVINQALQALAAPMATVKEKAQKNRVYAFVLGARMTRGDAL